MNSEKQYIDLYNQCRDMIMGHSVDTMNAVRDAAFEDFKRIAKKNNRSAEAQARSLIEDFTAGVLAHDIMSNSDLVQEMWDLLGDESLQPGEELAPPRTDDALPIDLG